MRVSPPPPSPSVLLALVVAATEPAARNSTSKPPVVVTIDRLECLNYSPAIMADPNGEGWIPVALVRTPSQLTAVTTTAATRGAFRSSRTMAMTAASRPQCVVQKE